MGVLDLACGVAASPFPPGTPAMAAAGLVREIVGAVTGWPVDGGRFSFEEHPDDTVATLAGFFR